MIEAKQKGMYVLVVDDEPAILQLMQTILENLGYQVTLCEGGKKAIDLMKTTRPHFDMAFIDVVMPEIDGVETCKFLKEIQPTINIVMMTGYAVEEKIQECMRYGIIDYLYKPFNIDQIENIIESKILKREILKSEIPFSLPVIPKPRVQAAVGKEAWGSHVLIVDDEHDICALLQEGLKRNLPGIHTHLAYNGESALEKLKEGPIHVLLVDIKMPSMTGIQLLKEVKKIDTEKEVILITGYADLDTAIEAVSLGAYDYIQKPFKSIARVTNTVKHACERYHLRQEEKRLMMTLQNRVHELDVLYDVSHLSTYMFSEQRMMSEISKALKKIVQYHDMANLLITSHGRRDLVTQIGSPVSEAFVRQGREKLLNAYNKLTNSNLKIKDLNIYVDVNREVQGDIKREVHSSFNIPLTDKKSVIGTLNISNHKEDAFTETEIKLFYTLANTLAAVLRTKPLS